MKSREQREAEQQTYLNAYDDVKERLLRIPGVVEVGVGVKETGGQLTEHLAFRVFVREKVPEDELSDEEVVPKKIDGFSTDVIKVRRRRLLIGFDDENDETNYSLKVGGIYIGNDNKIGKGTLGCFCRWGSHTVFLSCHHVLFDPWEPDPPPSHGSHPPPPAVWHAMQNKSRVGQPQYADLCCCVCNAMGTVLDGEPGLDCAIASLDSDVPFLPKIRQIKRNDGTVEANGFIAGQRAAVQWDQVWKIGARTGLTRGTVAQLTPDLEIHPLPPFTRFADHGDSGSVVVFQDTGDVVGLLKAMDDEINVFGYATPIQPILAFHGMTIIPTDASQTYNILEREEDRLDRLSAVTANSGFADLVYRLKSTQAGRWLLELIDIHGRECVHLVNTCRPVMVAWRRAQGPSFMAALARSGKVPEYRLPPEIEGVTRKQAALALQASFEKHGSDDLREDLQSNGDRLIEILVRCDTIEELIRDLEATRPVSVTNTVE
jgi:hypothetical protein